MRLSGVLALAVAACGGAPGRVAAPAIVEVPAPGHDILVASAAAHPTVAACPPGTSREHDVCVRVLPSPEIPAWQAPSFRPDPVDPCAAWTTDRGPAGSESAIDDGHRSE